MGGGKERCFQFVRDAGLEIEQAAQQHRVERPVLSVEDAVDDFLVGEGVHLAMHPGQGVVGVGQAHHLGGNGDALARQAVG